MVRFFFIFQTNYYYNYSGYCADYCNCCI